MILFVLFYHRLSIFYLSIRFVSIVAVRNRPNSLVHMRAIPAFLRVAGRYYQTTVVAQSVRHINPELSRVAYSLTNFLYQFIKVGTRATILRCFLIEFQRFQFKFTIIPASSSSEHWSTATSKHTLRHVLATFLEVHDRLGDLEIDRSYENFNIEWPQ